MTRTIAGTSVILIILATSASADVTDYKAFAESLIVQTRSGTEEQRVHQAKGYPTTEQNVPVQALTELDETGTSGSLLWSAYNRVLANDPQYNADVQADFIFETASGVADANVALATTSRARQTRTLEVLASEFPTFATGTELNLESQFLLDGGLMAAVPLTAGSADGLALNLALDIDRGETSLWSGTVALTGQEDGSLVTETTGAFHANDFVVTQMDVEGLGTVWLLTFDQKALTYEYQAEIGETFELAAELTVQLDVPGGLVAGAAFGTVPTETILLAQTLFGNGAQAGSAASAASVASAAPEPTTLTLIAVALSLVSLRRRRA